MGILRASDRLDTPDKIDSAISAEIPPDPLSYPRDQAALLLWLVLTHMVHGPCGERNPTSPCMKKKSCTKFYPKPFSAVTVIDPDSNKPIYRRRSPEQGGRQVMIKRGGREFLIDNSVIAPHSRQLLLRYHSHINVEVCTSAGGVKYLCGYFHKGSDRAMVQAQVRFFHKNRNHVCAKVEGERLDEIKEYVDTRVMCANEAAAGIFGFDVHRSFPPVTPLRLHLENEQIAIFADGEVEAAVQNPKSTELTAFFEFNQRPEEQLKEKMSRPRYVDMPNKHIMTGGVWRLRKKGCDAIGRVHNPSPLAGDVVYLRMLLHQDICRGATGFDNLKLGSENFKDACRHLNLLQVEI